MRIRTAGPAYTGERENFNISARYLGTNWVSRDCQSVSISSFVNKLL
jgi:hypothetical protein